MSEAYNTAPPTNQDDGEEATFFYSITDEQSGECVESGKVPWSCTTDPDEVVAWLRTKVEPNHLICVAYTGEESLHSVPSCGELFMAGLITVVGTDGRVWTLAADSITRLSPTMGFPSWTEGNPATLNLEDGSQGSVTATVIYTRDSGPIPALVVMNTLADIAAQLQAWRDFSRNPTEFIDKIEFERRQSM